MLLYVIAALSLVWLLVSTAWMRRTASPSTGAGPPPHESCAEPAMRLGGQADRRWLDLHEIYAGQAREMTGRALLFLGDSLTLHWLASPAWEKITKRFGPNVLNFGIGGDRTQHVLWRIANGELDFARDPWAVVLQIGTNNIGTDAPRDIARGAQAIIKGIRANLPASKIIVLGIPPRSRLPTNALRAKIDAYNRQLGDLVSAMPRVEFVPCPNFLNADGVFTRDYTIDFVHFTNKAYDAVAGALEIALGRIRR